MTTPVITPKVIYPNVIEAVPYNFNVPVEDETEIIVEFTDADGVDILADITYVLLVSKSMGSLLYDTNTIEITWVGAGVIPAVNSLKIFRRTSELQQTVYNFRADISVETAQEVDRLTRAQQDVYEKLDELDDSIENIEDNINPEINTADIVDGAVTTPKIADAAVTQAKIADGSVVASKLGAGSVTAVKIGTDAVTSVKIQNSAVTEAKLADDIISTVKIKDDAVTTAKIADTAITSSKLAQDVLDKFDQNIPFRFSLSAFSPKRLRIESAQIALNDSSNIGVSTGASLIDFAGIEIDLVTGDTFSLANVPIGVGVYTFPVPSASEYRTYLFEAKFGPVDSVGKTPLSLSVVGGQQAPILGNQVYPERSENKDLGLGYVTVQESGGSIADIVASNLVTLENNTNEDTNNIARIRVVAHTFTVGTSLIPVYWNGTEWLAADVSDVLSLATHLILDVISNEEFTIAFSGRIYYPAHGLDIGAYYFLGDTVGILDLVEADQFSNPLIQVETANYFTLLGWRANEKSITTNIAGVDQWIIPNLLASTPTEIISTNLAIIYSIQVYDTTRVQLGSDDIEIRIDDIAPDRFTLFSNKAWLDLRVDLVGVK